MRFTIGEDDFLLDGAPHRIVSGAMHYFRVHPAHWADRIHQARLMGLNTIETYVAWNMHEPEPGSFDFTGGLDLGAFLDAVHAEGMHAIVRPGPYICAEWWNGGLPPWLFTDPGVGVRRNEPIFLSAVRRYLEALAPVLLPRQIDAGGPIVLVQIENEYGAYGSDAAYLRALVDMHRAIGLTVPFTTVDQPIGTMLEDGSLPELHHTASFGSRATERLTRLRQAQPTGPLMCSEFWNGWFDAWGEHHHRTSAADSATELDALLAAGASVNIYMFHGGTNFGLTNGANDKGTYRPLVTSYDYDAPLDEAGRPTEKFWAYRRVISRYLPVPKLDDRPERAAPASAPATPSTPVLLDRTIPLFTLLEADRAHPDAVQPPTMESLSPLAHFAHYSATLDLQHPAVLTVGEVRDRAQVFVDGVSIGVLERENHDMALALPAAGRCTVEILVEDQGRVDYGPRIGEPKGLIGPVRIDGRSAHWTGQAIDIETLFGAGDAGSARLRAAPPEDARHPLAGPTAAMGTFDLPDLDPGGRFLSLEQFGKGVAWVNGFCLGRYWSRGPQRTLFVPAPVLRKEANELVVLELGAAASRYAELRSAPDLGPEEP